ncbi:MAG: DUF72 domain-containing protein [Actinobacteria bacterium]|nr:DUF72 domain-containing protein [Actinomycetota bacterium]MDI6831603.1 DUF72 domain-containing protein [Actinomycetota bacterium]
MAELRVGTSGWHYPHWKGVFYPEGLRGGEWLPFYASRFDTVEINNSFYRLPGREVFSSWARVAPPGFLFAVKASRYITHMKKLREAEDALAVFLENSSALGDKLGPILFQLPPRWKRDAARLAGFTAMLPPEHRYAFEFREASWLHEETYRVLEERGIALCIADSPSFPRSRRVTAPFAFLRFHGGTVLYGSRYSRQELRGWASFARSLLERGIDVYAYFNNDAHGYALEDAALFRELAGGEPPRP